MEKTTKNIGVMNFSMTGKQYQSQLDMFFREGEFKTFLSIVNDMELPFERVRDCFMMKYDVIGDMKDDSMAVRFNDYPPEDFAETLFSAIVSAVTSSNIEEYGFTAIINNNSECLDRIYGGENIKVLTRFLEPKFIIQLVHKQVIDFAGYKIFPDLKTALKENTERTINGLIISTGEFVQCGYQDHRDLMPFLYKLDLVVDSGFNIKDEDNTIHISSNLVSGGDWGYLIENEESWRGEKIPFKVAKSLWDACDEITDYYSPMSTIKVGTNLVRTIAQYNVGKGSKFGYLTFLKYYCEDFFSDEIKLVNFSINEDDINTDEVMIRTSPKFSMAGVLNSVTAYKDDLISVIVEITKDYAKHEDLIHGNELHYFFQDYLVGDNGVANYDADGFKYSVSETRGNVVKGANGDVQLEVYQEKDLESFMKKLYGRIHNKIQVEFVVTENVIYIVQLRVFKNEETLQNDASEKSLDEAIIIGKTFHDGTSFGKWQTEVDVDDILIVDSEADSTELIGKKALIVMDDTDFSHILALSVALNIPSIYGVSTIRDDIKKYKTVSIDTKHKQATVTIKN